MKHIILAGTALAAIQRLASEFTGFHTFRIPVFIQNSPLGSRCKYAVQSLKLVTAEQELPLLREKLLRARGLINSALEAIDAFENSEQS